MNEFSGETVFNIILSVCLARYLSIMARFSSFSRKSNLWSVAADGSSGSGPYTVPLMTFDGKKGKFVYGAWSSSKSTICPVFLSLTR